MATLQLSAASVEDRVVYADTSKTNTFSKECSIIANTDSEYATKSTANEITGASISFSAYYTSTWSPSVQVAYHVQAYRNGTWTNIGLSGNKIISKQSASYSASASISNIDGLFGSNMPLRVYIELARTGGDYYRAQAWVTNIRVNLIYTPKNWVTFTGTGVVTHSVSCNVKEQPTDSYVNHGLIPTGYEFDKWTDGNQTYAYGHLPKCTGVDVTYTSTTRKKTYTVLSTAVNQSGGGIRPPAAQTSDVDYQIGGDSISASAPSAPYDIDGDGTVKYLFEYWSAIDSSGHAIGTDVWSNTTELGVLDTTKIDNWFADGNSITLIAHYRRIYDIELLVSTNSTDDPSGVGKNGISSITVTSGGETQSFDLEDILDSNNIARVTDPNITIGVEFTDSDEYGISYYLAIGVDNEASAPTTEWDGDTFYYSNVWMSSSGQFDIVAHKNYFDITFNSNPDGAVKVYQNGVAISPTHIVKGSTIVVDARVSATEDTKYNATLFHNGTAVPNNYYTITELLQDYEFGVTTTVQNYTISTIVNDGTPSVATVARTDPYTFTVAYEEGFVIPSATITMGSRVEYSTSNVTSVSYTLQSITDNCVFTVRRTQDPTEYVSIDTSNCEHGSVIVANGTSILKSQFQYFDITDIAADPEYTVSGATYEWKVDGTTVASDRLTLGTENHIEYTGTIPADSIVVCYIYVTFCKNLLFYSTKQNNIVTIDRPSALYYTPTTGSRTPHTILAVFAQTHDNPDPIVLYGDPSTWETTTVVSNTLSYAWNSVTATLTVMCSGDIPDYSSGQAPWYRYRKTARHLVIGSGCTKIGNNAFYDFQQCIDVDLPSGILSIGTNAFYHCTALVTITLPNTVTNIGNSAFRFCTHMSTWTIPSSVTTIERSAFENNDRVESFYFCGTPTTISSSQVLLNIGSLLDDGYCTVYMPWSEGAVAGYPWGAPSKTHWEWDYVNNSST